MDKIDIKEILKISKKAGKEILEVYKKQDFSIVQKEDTNFKEGFSPLTEADTRANDVITNFLSKKYPKIPIYSEEGSQIPFEDRMTWKLFWLIDPLDGTKDFIQRTGEFTVNIALIKNNKPILGVVYVPVKDTWYYGDTNGSYKKIKQEEPQKLPLNEKRDSYVVVASKNHTNKETLDFIENLNKEHQNLEFLQIGSSLKLCMVAEGKADIYPRLVPTKEWDTAAAHAVVNFAGKKVYELNKDSELQYNKEKVRNPFFIVK